MGKPAQKKKREKFKQLHPEGRKAWAKKKKQEKLNNKRN